MPDLRLNYPSIKQEADIFQQYVSGLTAQEKYALLYPAPMIPDAASLERLGAWLHLQPDMLHQQLDVTTTCSGNSAGHCILAVLKDREHTVAIETFTYNNFKLAGQALGYRFRTIDCDEEGMMPDALAQYLQTGSCRLVYVQPTVHNPTCSVMSLQRREAIAAVVRSFNDVYLVEDDAYRFLHASPPPTFLALMPERTIHVCSFSKIFNPFLRIAYILYPKGLLQGIDPIIRITTSGSSALFNAFVQHLLQHALLPPIGAEKRRIAIALHEKITAIFEGLDYRLFPGSYHMWVKLPAHLPANVFVPQMKAKGIDVMSSEDFSVHGNQEYIRIAMGAAWSSPELIPALETIAKGLR
ncbi:MAG TPA: PLP-dependent aminotransferase family protein [Chitinophaga sp.]|uniref:PLP-dependent aminotransferase family protein n=1 Tax=Chitinophaga sp. TaxID=1869181 RepID=UPI002DB93078|nr:PLP-dependent aminotransferase family protein [Chitinophaga sp.]HEU4555161.1 PLP-dependent aminotransferase family protein [Chitinophaga sp.]